MRRYKYLKIFSIGLVLFLVLGLAGLEIFSRVYRARAAAFFREQFARQSDLVLQPFTTTVTVWRQFPRITFVLNNLALVDTTGVAPLTVLAVQRAEIVLPLGQFRPDELKVSQVELDDVLFHQRIDSLGRKLGLRFKKGDNDPAGNSFALHIPRLTLRRVRVLSENQYKKNDFAISIQEANLGIQLTGQVLSASGNLAGKVDLLSSNKVIVYQDQPFTGNLHYAFDLNSKKGRIHRTTARVNGQQLRISGSHSALADGVGANLDLIIAGRQPLLYLINQFMPKPAQTFMNRVQTKSSLAFIYRSTGVSGPTQRPRNRLWFKLLDGQLYLPALKSQVEEARFEGMLDNGPGHGPETSRFWIKEFSVRSPQDSFRLALTVVNFNDPAFTFSGKGQIGLTQLAAFVQLPFTRIEAGTLRGNVTMRGKIPVPGQVGDPGWRGEGAVELQQGAFQLQGLRVACRQVNGRLQFKDQLLQMPALSGTVGGYAFKLQGSVHNFLSYLFRQPGLVRNRADIYLAHLDTDWFEKPGGTSPKVVRGRTGQGTNHKRHNRGQANALLQMQTQVNLRVERVNLPLREQIRQLTVRVDQQGEKINLARMRFVAAGGGVATADGGFRWTAAGIQSPHLHVRLQYPSLNLQTFMQDLAALQSSRTGPGRGAQQQAGAGLATLNDYHLTLQVNAKKLQYLYLRGTDLVLAADLNPRQVRIRQLDLRTAGGEIHSRGVMDISGSPDRLPVRLRAELHNLDLQRVFAMAEQMQLDVLGSRNIRGAVTCQLTVLTELDQTFSPSLDRTVAYARADLRHLELIDVAPLQQALRLVRKERTRHLVFQDVRTHFLLRRQEFLTPGLRLNSNLTDLNLSGRYTMGGPADLNLDISLLQVLFGNNSRRKERIQSESEAAAPKEGNQHLRIRREQGKYHVGLSGRRQREAQVGGIKTEMHQLIRQHQIDTVFTMHPGRQP